MPSSAPAQTLYFAGDSTLDDGNDGLLADAPRLRASDPRRPVPLFVGEGNLHLDFCQLWSFGVCVNDINDDQGYFSLDVIREKE